MSYADWLRQLPALPLPLAQHVGLEADRARQQCIEAIRQQRVALPFSGYTNDSDNRVTE